MCVTNVIWADLLSYVLLWSTVMMWVWQLDRATTDEVFIRSHVYGRSGVIECVLSRSLPLWRLLNRMLAMRHSWMRFLLHILAHYPSLKSLVGGVTWTFARDIVDLLVVRRVLWLGMLSLPKLFAETTLFFHQLVLILEERHIRWLSKELWVRLRK